MNPSLQKTRDFLAFHEKHPDLRWWQALLAFTKEKIILRAKDNGELEDTFHLLP